MPQRGTRVLTTLAALIVVVAGVKAAADIVNPFLLACFAAVMVAPLMTWCVRRGLPRGAALTLVLAVLVGVVALLGRLLSTSVASFQRQMPVYEQRLEGELGGLVQGLADWLEELGLVDGEDDGDDPAEPPGLDGGPDAAEPGQGPQAQGGEQPDPGGAGDPELAADDDGSGSTTAPDGADDPTEEAAEALVEALLGDEPAQEAAASPEAGAEGGDPSTHLSLREMLRTQLLEVLDPGVVFVFLRRLLAALGGMLGNGLVILLMIAFLLAEGSTFPRKLRLISRDPDRATRRWHAIGDDINRYMAIKTGTSLVTGIVVALWLMILGVDFPLLWGTLAFLLNYVPNLGSVLAALPAVLLALVQLGPGTAGLVVIGYGVVNFVVGSVLEPRSMGRGLGLSTLVVFLSLVFWGWVLGPIGMLLSVPLTMAVKIALEAADDTRWIGVVLGSEKSLLAHALQGALPAAVEAAPTGAAAAGDGGATDDDPGTDDDHEPPPAAPADDDPEPPPAAPSDDDPAGDDPADGDARPRHRTGSGARGGKGKRKRRRRRGR